ncbi:MAG TPA: hypothetical protein VI752_01995 [Candidatus Paceibacterota bacterium]
MKRRSYLTVWELSLFTGVLLVAVLVLLVVTKDAEVERRHVFVPAPARTTLDNTREPEEISGFESTEETTEAEVLSAEEQLARSVGMTWERTIPLSVVVENK